MKFQIYAIAQQKGGVLKLGQMAATQALLLSEVVVGEETSMLSRPLELFRTGFSSAGLSS